MLDIPSDMMYELQLLIINTMLKPLNLDAYSYMIKTGMYLVIALMNRSSTPTHDSYNVTWSKIAVLANHMTHFW